MALSELFKTDPEGGPCLIGSKCTACGTVVFPKMPVCPSCRRNGEIEELKMGRTARLYSHTIAHVAPKGFLAPYFQAFVELREGPRIFTLIGRDCPVQNGILRDGMEMRLIVEPLADTAESREVLTYKYLPTSIREGRDA